MALFTRPLAGTAAVDLAAVDVAIVGAGDHLDGGVVYLRSVAVSDSPLSNTTNSPLAALLAVLSQGLSSSLAVPPVKIALSPGSRFKYIIHPPDDWPVTAVMEYQPVFISR